jgi:hypothetical protein
MVVFRVPANIQVYGSPGSGKSYMMNFLLCLYLLSGQVSWVNVITGTPSDWEWLAKKNVIIDDEETRKRLGCPDKIKGKDVNLYDWYLKTKLIPYLATPGTPPGIVVLDDLTGAVSYNQQHWKFLFTRFRHYCRNEGEKEGKFVFLAAFHFGNNIQPTQRESCTRSFVFEQQSDDALVATYKAFGNKGIGSQKEWNDFMGRFSNRDSKTCIMYTKEPQAGEKMYMPVKAPEMPTNLKELFEEEPPKKNNKRKVDESEEQPKRQRVT